jgi:hypothetical protein
VSDDAVVSDERGGNGRQIVRRRDISHRHRGGRRLTSSVVNPWLICANQTDRLAANP